MIVVNDACLVRTKPRTKTVKVTKREVKGLFIRVQLNEAPFFIVISVTKIFSLHKNRASTSPWVARTMSHLVNKKLACCVRNRLIAKLVNTIDVTKLSFYQATKLSLTTCELTRK
jgi:hypothetical protein